MLKDCPVIVGLGVFLRAQCVTDVWKLAPAPPRILFRSGKVCARAFPFFTVASWSFPRLLPPLSVNVFINGALPDRTRSRCGSLHGRVGQVWILRHAFGVGQCGPCPGPLWAVKWTQADQAHRLKTD